MSRTCDTDDVGSPEGTVLALLLPVAAPHQSWWDTRRARGGDCRVRNPPKRASSTSNRVCDGTGVPDENQKSTKMTS